jgi:chromosomal replication initiator protein
MVPSRVTCPMIVAAAAKHFDVSVRDVLGPYRGLTVVKARHVAMWVMRELRGLSLPQIARRTGRSDHTSALHGCRRVEQMPALLEAAQQIRAALTAPAAPPAEGGACGE